MSATEQAPERGEDGAVPFDAKADFAVTALNVYRTIVGEKPVGRDDVEALSISAVDWLADLGHWARLNDVDIYDLMDRAAVHMHAEAGNCFACGGPVAKVDEQQPTPFCKLCNPEEGTK